MIPVMVESRFLRHLASFGTPRGTGFFALGLEGGRWVAAWGLPNEKVRTADAAVGFGRLTALPSEKVLRVFTGLASAGAFGGFVPFAAR